MPVRISCAVIVVLMCIIHATFKCTLADKEEVGRGDTSPRGLPAPSRERQDPDKGTSVHTPVTDSYLLHTKNAVMLSSRTTACIKANVAMAKKGFGAAALGDTVQTIWGAARVTDIYPDGSGHLRHHIYMPY
jgi:hypothetical protein